MYMHHLKNACFLIIHGYVDDIKNFKIERIILKLTIFQDCTEHIHLFMRTHFYEILKTVKNYVNF